MFFKKRRIGTKVNRRREIPDGLWTKCKDCGDIIYNKRLKEGLLVCPKCGYHFMLTAYERIDLLLDRDRFEEYDSCLLSKDPLDFYAVHRYTDKIEREKVSTGLNEAAVCGIGEIEGRKVSFAVTDARFIMGSMGSVVGEKITRAIERAEREGLPLIIVSGSGGGARMQEGLFSLMQMAKTSGALGRLKAKGIPYISVLTNPTMAGVMASFASLGDIVMAEPGALIGFTGPRVIEQTIRQRLPEGFQRSEFLLEHGLIDLIVHRREMKKTIASLLDYLT